eukprot:3416271-Amphidinium_carterae.1
MTLLQACSSLRTCSMSARSLESQSQPVLLKCRMCAGNHSSNLSIDQVGKLTLQRSPGNINLSSHQSMQEDVRSTIDWKEWRLPQQSDCLRRGIFDDAKQQALQQDLRITRIIIRLVE